MPGIVVHTSHRLEDLAAALAGRLHDDPLPPLASETIVVPTRGLARWLELALAERHGIAAGYEFPFPGAFLARLGARSSGPDLFAKDVLRLRLFRLLGDARRSDELGLAAAYCADDADGQKRWQLAERLAQVFDDYQLYRDDLLRRAAAGDELGDQGPHGPWQSRLWRALLQDAGLAAAAPPKRRRGDATPLLFPDLDAPAVGLDAAHRLDGLRTLLAEPARARAVLPPRLSVFGAGSLPPAFVELLQQIGRQVPVHLYVPVPTPHWFGDAKPRDHAGSNPLLARLGTLAREFQDRLVGLEDDGGGERIDLTPAPDPHERAPTLLACLQRDIAAVFDRTEAAAEKHPLRADDDSLRIHDCHSPLRELEVVRDQVLDAFARDSRLQPHEILVLVPDIATYAPYAEAVFGPVRDHVPFQVADRNPAHELPLGAALLQVLQLAGDRLAVYDVLHLGENASVLRRFGLAANELPTLRHWCRRAGIRWGLDGASRARRFRVPPFEANSWQQGLDRMLLGLAAGPVDDLVLGALPAADATTGRDDLLQRFFAFVRTLFAHLPGLQTPLPPAVWADRLDALLAALFDPATPDDEQALQRLQGATADLRTQAAAAKLTEPLAPPVLRDWLVARLQETASGRGFFGGAMTIAALQPMRTVPARHLFVCGLADASFPRRDQPAPFDLVQQQRRPGDRSVRLDDRQLFLDVLLAARERLHLCWVGHSQKDDSECAPSVVLAELLDWVARACAAPDAKARIVVRHPLQPWSRRYLDRRDPRLFTYGHGPAAAVPPATDDGLCFVTGSVDGTPEPSVLVQPEQLDFTRLLEFWRHPSRTFLTQTLRLRLPRTESDEPETEPFVLSPLDRWRLLAPLATRVLRGDTSSADPLAAARATGLLPVGGRGALAYHAAADRLDDFVRRMQELPHPGTALLQVQIGGTLVVGTVDGLGPDFAVRGRLSNLKNKYRLQTWLEHLLLAAARATHPTPLPTRTCYVARDKTLQIGEIAPETATAHLAELLALHRQGLRQPLPFYEHSSYAYADGLRQKDRKSKPSPESALRAARGAWEPDQTDNRFGSDLDDVSIALCARGADPLAEPSFAELACRVWNPFLTLAREDS
jgi:exodeoxyribonuclease V gamma subunit